MSWKSAARFYHQLALVHRTGIAIAPAVEMAGIASSDRHRALAPAWSRGCATGGQLADQLEASEEPALSVALIRAGETSGKLPEMAQTIAEHYEHAIALRSLVIARLIYPVILVNFALMVPAIPPVFLGTAPAWMVLVGPGALWGVVAVMVVVGIATKRSGLAARFALRRGLRFFTIPLILANTCTVLRASLGAGMLVPDALELAAGSCGNRAVAARLTAAAADVRNDRLPDLTSALETCPFPYDLMQLIRNGETAGKVEETLRQVAVVSEESFRSRTMWAAKILAGIAYGLAILVAVIVIFSMMSGYVNMISSTARELDS
ncbi:MAG: type II secretion system F family protein [Planctomycetes bacterium]|nr:type II secretion system F family protein [Planctomycetota bacterium]